MYLLIYDYIISYYTVIYCRRPTPAEAPRPGGARKPRCVFMCVCMYVYIYIYIYIYIFIYLFVYLFYVYIYIYIHTCVYVERER